jgi:hypothetical protein
VHVTNWKISRIITNLTTITETRMVNVEYHKGSFCVYKSKFCQEGFCSGCEIYLKKPSLFTLIKQSDQHVAIKLKDLVH